MMKGSFGCGVFIFYRAPGLFGLATYSSGRL
jgi:hypothetical protein